MVSSQKTISVFISSPSDVSREREIAIEVMQEVNRLKGNSLGYNFVPITWENDVVPVFGGSPQEIIDSQLDYDFDVFLGIMSTRFGTPTENANSGTQHEFEKTYQRKVNSPNSVEIMFCFQEPGHSGRPIDVNELAKVVNFKTSISDKGLYAEYTTIDDFRIKITAHLAGLMDRIIDQNRPETAEQTAADFADDGLKEQSVASKTLADPMSFLNQLELDDEPGFLELSEQVEDSMVATTPQLEALTSAMSKLGAETKEHVKKLNPEYGQISPTQYKAIFKAASRSMDAFVETSTAILPLFHSHLAEGLLLSRELIIVLSQDNIGTADERENIIFSFQEMQNGMRNALASFENLSETLESIPRTTSSFNRAKKRTMAIIDGICALLSSATDEVEQIIKAVDQN